MKEIQGKDKQPTRVVPAHVVGTSGDIVTIEVDEGDASTALFFRFTQRLDWLVPRLFASCEHVCRDVKLLLHVLPSDVREVLEVPDSLDIVGSATRAWTSIFAISIRSSGWAASERYDRKENRSQAPFATNC